MIQSSKYLIYTVNEKNIQNLQIIWKLFTQGSQEQHKAKQEGKGFSVFVGF